MRARLPRLVLIAAALALSACGGARTPYQPTTPAVVGDYAPYLGQGTATITGQAFLQTTIGQPVKAAGMPVTVDPWTPYAQAWFFNSGGKRDRFNQVPSDTLFARARRTATADADGRFSVANLPPGLYLVRSIVTWTSGYTTQGGVVADTVRVAAGETKSVVLSTMAR